MKGNPEFRRNLWIQFTGTRVLVASLLTGLLLACALAVDYGLTRNNFVPDITGFVAYWLAVAILMFWAGRQAAGAVMREIRGRTWDAQRLSTVHPWTMAWGKLFGATSLAWFMAAISVAAYLGADGYQRSFRIVAAGAGALIGYGLVCQATGMLASLARLSGRPGERGGGTTVAHVVGVVATGLLVAFVYWGLQNEARWFGLEIGRQGLELLTIWFFALWAVAGVYRRMRRELQMRSAPWAWLLFLATFVVYGEGLAYGRGQPEAALLLPAALLAVMLWTVTLIEAKDPLTLRQSLQALGGGRLRDGASIMPLWLVTYVVLALVVAGAIVFGAGGSVSLRVLRIPGQPEAETLLILIGLFLFVTRDVFIVQALALGREANLAGVYGGFAWFILYLAVAAVLVAGRQTELLGLVLPTGQGGWLIAVLPAAVQAAICVVLFVWRWRVYWRENAAKAPAA
jgi:hypothetical protein